jgi:hypothetical protein
MDKLDEVNSLLPRFRQLPREVQLELIKLVAFAGSLAMAQLLIGPLDNIKCETAVQSIKGENIEVLRWAVSKFAYQCYDSRFVHRAAMNSNSKEVFEIWKTYLAEDDSKKSGWVLDRHVISRINNPMQEIRMVALWKDWASLGRLQTRDFGAGLKGVAQTTCSTVLARALLDCGANVDFKRLNIRTEMTPLHHAAKKATAEAAELMKLLLLSGADPGVTAVIRGKTLTPSMERGARNISKRLGMTWDELVKWAQEERKKMSQNGGGSVAE